MSWKDNWRDHKEETGLSWSEYHDRWFVHRNDMDDLTEQMQAIEELLEATKNTYQKMHREVFEANIMEDYDDE